MNVKEIIDGLECPDCDNTSWRGSEEGASHDACCMLCGYPVVIEEKGDGKYSIEEL